MCRRREFSWFQLKGVGGGEDLLAGSLLGGGKRRRAAEGVFPKMPPGIYWRKIHQLSQIWSKVYMEWLPPPPPTAALCPPEVFTVWAEEQSGSSLSWDKRVLFFSPQGPGAQRPQISVRGRGQADWVRTERTRPVNQHSSTTKQTFSCLDSDPNSRLSQGKPPEARAYAAMESTAAHMG